MLYVNLFSATWMFLIPLLSVLVPVWLGQRYGLYVIKRGRKIVEDPISTAVSAALALFAFMLAFTFQIVGNRYDKRKQLLVDEISNLRTTYLYAGLVPEPIRSNTRKAVIDYVDLRIKLYLDPSTVQEVRNRSQEILDSLWGYSEALAAQDRSSEAYSLYMGSINDMVSSFNQRVMVTFQIRLPDTILYVLSIVAFVSMLALGYQFGISGSVNFLVVALLGVTFSAVMWLVFALDRPEAGLIKLHTAPLKTLYEQLHGHPISTK